MGIRPMVMLLNPLNLKNMTIIILMSIFVLSYILAFVWSYLIVHTTRFNSRLINDLSIGVPVFLKRNKLAIKNFFIVSITTCASLLMVGDSFFSFQRPSILYFLFNFILFIVVDDIWFYFIHRLMHTNKWIYRNIHKVHHKAHPPIPIDYLYTHPLEAMSSSFGFILGVILSIAVYGQVSFYVFTGYIIYRTIHELIVHSSLTVIPKKWLGIFGSSEHHFNHHKYLNGNYASAFTYLDKIFGTDLKDKTVK
ncbi:MAG: sterol desaturase family protein [Spirosomataceae bacterium]